MILLVGFPMISVTLAPHGAAHPRTAAVRARPRADQRRVERAAGARQHRRPRPRRRGRRLRALLVRRAPPQPRGRRHLPAVVLALTAAATVDDPARLGRRADGAPHRAVDRSRSSVCSMRCTRAARPRPRPLRRAPAGRRRPARPTGPGGRSRTGAPNGLLHPAAVLLRRTCSARRASPCRRRCSSSRGAEPPDYDEQVDDVLALLARHLPVAGGRRGPRRARARAPTSRSGSSAAAAARAPRSPGRAGCRSPPTTTSLRRRCSRPSTAYRAAFRPSAASRPAARRGLRRRRRRRRRRPRPASWPPATGCGCAASAPAAGAIPFPTPEEARAPPWTDADRALVQDRIDTQFVGDRRRTVADQLERPRRRDRGRRAADHDDHPRPRRPGPLLRTARRRVGVRSSVPVASGARP